MGYDSSSETYVIVDIETTGLSKERHHITEIAAVKISDGIITDKFETLVDPGVPIPSHITRLTGIDDDTVAGAPSIADAMNEFVSFTGDSTIVAHNASFDLGFLRHHAQNSLSFELNNRSLCTRNLSRKLMPGLRSAKLSSLCDMFGIENENAHRAMSDVKATYQLFTQLQSMMSREPDA